jgi:hypothetical protein
MKNTSACPTTFNTHAVGSSEDWMFSDLSVGGTRVGPTLPLTNRIQDQKLR